MPFEDAKTYRFNPFDLTKVWPHGDYPLIEVGRMTLDRNPDDYHAQIEQAAFEPSNLVPGIGPSPGQDAAGPAVLLRRRPPLPDRRRTTRSCRSTSRKAAGALLRQGRPDARTRTAATPVVRAELQRRPGGRPERFGEPAGWEVDGEMVRAAVHAARARTTTSARPARWCARCWTTPPATGWSPTSSAT